MVACLAEGNEGDWEVIVADNGSTDATRRIVGRYLERTSRVRLVDASARRGGRLRGLAGFGGELSAIHSVRGWWRSRVVTTTVAPL